MDRPESKEPPITKQECVAAIAIFVAAISFFIALFALDKAHAARTDANALTAKLYDTNRRLEETETTVHQFINAYRQPRQR